MKKSFVNALLLLVATMLLGGAVALAQDATPEATEAMVDRTDWPTEFVIGIYPGDNPEAALAELQPLAEYLTERLGVPTRLISATSYTAVIEAMRAGRADAIDVGPFAYVLAVQEANAEALVVGVYYNTVPDFSMDNYDEVVETLTSRVPGYFSLLFTVKGSGIRGIEDLEGRSFALTDPASTSGYLIPAVTVMTRADLEDVEALENYVDLTLAGNHPAAVLAVANGTVDAGGTFDGNLPAQHNQDLIDLCGYDAETNSFPYYEPMTQEEIDAIYDTCEDGQVVVFAQSPIIPVTPLGVRADLPESFKAALRAALLDMVNYPEVVLASQRSFLDPTEELGLETLDNYYDVLREAAIRLELDLGAN